MPGLIGEPGGPRKFHGPRVTKSVPQVELLLLVIESVHVDNLGVLPPSPEMLACKGEQIGLGRYAEFFCEVTDVEWYRRNRLY